MNKKNLKLIMELIFIFILPLIFICFTSEIQVQRQFTYDNQGNYETSQDTKQLSFDNSIIKYTKSPLYTNYFNLYQYIDDVSRNGSIGNLLLTKKETYNIILNGNLEEYTNTQWGFDSYIPKYNHQYLVYLDKTLSNVTIQINDYNINNQEIGRFITSSYIFTSTNYENNQIPVGIYLNPSLSNFDNYSFKINIIDLTESFGIGNEPSIQWYEDNINNFYNYSNGNEIIIESNSIISDNYRINYSIWGNIKELLINNLDLNDNVLLDIVLCYTILWLVMFLIWHLIYGFLELIFHIIPKRWERDFE